MGAVQCNAATAARDDGMASMHEHDGGAQTTCFSRTAETSEGSAALGLDLDFGEGRGAERRLLRFCLQVACSMGHGHPDGPAQVRNSLPVVEVEAALLSTAASQQPMSVSADVKLSRQTNGFLSRVYFRHNVWKESSPEHISLQHLQLVPVIKDDINLFNLATRKKKMIQKMG